MNLTSQKAALVLAFLTTSLILSCSKDESPDGGGNGNYPASLSGVIYYKWVDQGILKMKLPEGEGSSFIPDDTKLNNFDISPDNQERLTVTNASTLGQYDIRFTISSLADNRILEEFIYNSPAGNSYCKGYLSPDKNLIMVTSNDSDDGITVLKRNGEFITRFDRIGGEPFEINETRLWLPDSSLLITHKKNIIRIPHPYNQGSLVKEMEYDDWGDLAVNQQGSMLALRIGNHLHLMGMDGTGLRQITTSNFKEADPVFSPDGSHLLIGSNYRQASVFGFVSDLKIIPVNGGPYNVDPIQTNSPEAIPVIWKGKDRIESADGQILWR